MSAAKTVVAATISILLMLVTGGLLLKPGIHGPVAIPGSASPGEFLWQTRDFETILQGLLILGGVFAILMLLRAAKQGTMQ